MLGRGLEEQKRKWNCDRVRTVNHSPTPFPNLKKKNLSKTADRKEGQKVSYVQKKRKNYPYNITNEIGTQRDTEPDKEIKRKKMEL